MGKGPEAAACLACSGSGKKADVVAEKDPAGKWKTRRGRGHGQDFPRAESQGNVP